MTKQSKKRWIETSATRSGQNGDAVTVEAGGELVGNGRGIDAWYRLTVLRVEAAETWQFELSYHEVRRLHELLGFILGERKPSL